MPQAPCLSKSCTLRFRAGASSGLGHWGAAGPSRFSWPDSQTFSNYPWRSYEHTRYNCLLRQLCLRYGIARPTPDLQLA